MSERHAANAPMKPWSAMVRLAGCSTVLGKRSHADYVAFPASCKLNACEIVNHHVKSAPLARRARQLSWLPSGDLNGLRPLPPGLLRLVVVVVSPMLDLVAVLRCRDAEPIG